MNSTNPMTPRRIHASRTEVNQRKARGKGAKKFGSDISLWSSRWCSVAMRFDVGGIYGARIGRKAIELRKTLLIPHLYDSPILNRQSASGVPTAGSRP